MRGCPYLQASLSALQAQLQELTQSAATQAVALQRQAHALGAMQTAQEAGKMKSSSTHRTCTSTIPPPQIQMQLQPSAVAVGVDGGLAPMGADRSSGASGMHRKAIPTQTEAAISGHVQEVGQQTPLHSTLDQAALSESSELQTASSSRWQRARSLAAAWVSRVRSGRKDRAPGLAEQEHEAGLLPKETMNVLVDDADDGHGEGLAVSWFGTGSISHGGTATEVTHAHVAVVTGGAAFLGALAGAAAVLLFSRQG